jgi:hypothetical protein
MEKFRNTPPVGEARLAPRRKTEAVDTIAEAKVSPETLAEIDAAETELKAQLALLSSQREKLASLDVVAQDEFDTTEHNKMSYETFVEIQESYRTSVEKIQLLTAIGFSAALGSILTTGIADSLYKSDSELLMGKDMIPSDTAINLMGASTVGAYAVLALGGIALLLNKWKKSREDKARYS